MPPTKEFTTDGCSGFLSVAWRLFTHRLTPWEGCCTEHDKAYWRGGPKHLRLEADSTLMQSVAANGHPYWAWLMFAGVRIGGMWWLPFPSLRQVNGKWRFRFDGVRWGYGFRYPRYKE
jgi:hypothetical protein